MSGVIQWMVNHRVFILGTVTVCLFVSTMAALIGRSHNEDEGSTKMATRTRESPLIQENFYRLPLHVKPKNYKLTLHPNTFEKIFDGTVIIKIQVLQSIKNVILHSNKLSIISVNMREENASLLDRQTRYSSNVQSWHLSQDKRQLLTVNLQKETREGNYELEIKFAGRLDEGIVGFYASKLKNGGMLYLLTFKYY